MTKIQDWEAMLPKETVEFMCSLSNRRRSGRSTKMADHYIEQLFTSGCCKSIDHSLNTESSKYLASVIIKRLELEHGCAVLSPFDEKPLREYNVERRKCFDYDGMYTFTALN